MKSTLLILSVFAVSLNTAWPATEITIANHSFEEVSVPDGHYTVNTIPGWLGEGSWYHVANPINGIFSGTTDGGPGPSPIDGHNTAAVNNFGQHPLSDTD